MANETTPAKHPIVPVSESWVTSHRNMNSFFITETSLSPNKNPTEYFTLPVEIKNCLLLWRLTISIVKRYRWSVLQKTCQIPVTTPWINFFFFFFNANGLTLGSKILSQKQFKMTFSNVFQISQDCNICVRSCCYSDPKKAKNALIHLSSEMERPHS